MKRFLIFVAIAFSALTAAAQPVAKTSTKANLTILTDENMLLPLAPLARLYASQSSTPLTIVVKNAETAEKQIEQGLEAHVIITANTGLMDRLIEQGLTDVSSRRTLARTQLALVTTRDLSQQMEIAQRISFASILAATPNMPVFTNDPATLEGSLAKALLTGHSFSEMLSPRLSAKATHEDVVTALRDEDSLGLILAADAIAEPDVRVLSLLPESVSAPVSFEAAVLGSESMNEARHFTNFLLTRSAQQVFKDFGYQPLYADRLQLRERPACTRGDR